MRKLILITILLISFFSFNVFALSENDDITVDYILSGIQHNASLIKNIAVNYKLIFSQKLGKSEEKILWEYDMKWVKKGNLQYLERTDLTNGSQIISSITPEGENLTWYKNPKNPEDPGLGSIGEEETDLNALTYYPPERFAFDVAKPQKPRAFVKLTGIEIVNRHLCYIVKKGFNNFNGEQRYWIDIKQGFQPLKIEIGTTDGKILFWFDSIKLEEFAGGIWIPVEAICHQDEDYKGVYKTVEVAINQDIPDEQFILKWTDGTIVTDVIRGLNFKIGQDITAEELLEQIRELKEEKE